MDLDLKNKYALITGGSHGIGREIALSLAEEGCNVAICARDPIKIEETLRQVKKYDVKILGIICDVLIKTDVNNVIKTIIDEWGGINVLINNVGGGGRWGDEDILKTSEDVWMDVYEKNVFAAIRFTNGFLPDMIKNKWGRVVTISSISGIQIHSRPWFGMAKSSEIYLMKSYARQKEYTRSNITFNSIAPGAIMVEGTGWHEEREKDHKAFDEKIKNIYPLGRLGSSQEVANIAIFLCSDKASLVNGTCIIADGAESVNLYVE